MRLSRLQISIPASGSSKRVTLVPLASTVAISILLSSPPDRLALTSRLIYSLAHKPTADRYSHASPVLNALSLKLSLFLAAILRRSNQEKIEPLPIEETKGFGNCIPEHERLMLKTQNIKNSIDIEQEENLPQYHTTFIIKTLYEKPKNLPGEDPEYPNVKIISTNNDTNEEEYSSEEEEDGQEIITENNENNLDEKKQTQENINNENREPEELDDQNDIKKLLDEIMNGDEFEIKYPELGSVLNDELAQKYQEQIIEAKKAEERKKEELENKKLSENENKNIKGDDKKKEPTEKISYSFDPQFPEGWNNGNFELVINHCYDCDQHTKTTKHYEYTFMDKFNAIGDEVKAKFPNCRVYGNVDEREYLGNFDVYLRYTGLPSDYKGRFLIYSKKEET